MPAQGMSTVDGVGTRCVDWVPSDTRTLLRVGCCQRVRMAKVRGQAVECFCG